MKREDVYFKNGKGSVALPIVTMTNGITIRFFDPYDIRYSSAIIDQMMPHMELAKKDGFETIVVPATKPVPYAWHFAHALGFNLVVIRKEIKPYFPERIEFSGKSITSFSENTFYISADDIEYLKGKKVIFFDDVLSSGGTYEACKHFLLGKAQCAELRSLFIFKEGESYKEGAEVTWCGFIPFK